MTAPPTWKPPPDWSPSAAREHLRAVLHYWAGCPERTKAERALVLAVINAPSEGLDVLGAGDRFGGFLVTIGTVPTAPLYPYLVPIAARKPRQSPLERSVRLLLCHVAGERHGGVATQRIAVGAAVLLEREGPLVDALVLREMVEKHASEFAHIHHRSSGADRSAQFPQT